jgi:peptide/nickel transport system permease protein
VLTVLSLTFIGSTVRDALSVARPKAAGTQARGSGPGHALATPGPSAPTLAVVPTLLDVRGLVVSFDRGGEPTVVVDGVDLAVHRSEVRGLVGETGCGKTVTALSIPRLLATGGTISAGSIQLDGQELISMSEAELQKIRGKRIGLISQQPLAALDPSFTVQSQLSEVIRIHKRCSHSEARTLTWTKLEEVGLADPQSVGRRFPHQISGGMAQRVAIAIALAGEPDVLIADEPTTALDVTIQAGILDLLRDLVEQRSMGLLLVTHDLGVVADICDRVTVMYAGQVVEEGPASAVLSRPTHPYTRGLLASTPQLGSDSLQAIEGTVVPPELWPTGCRFANRCPYVVDRCRVAPVDLTEVDGQQSRCIRTAEFVSLGRRWVAGG